MIVSIIILLVLVICFMKYPSKTVMVFMICYPTISLFEIGKIGIHLIFLVFVVTHLFYTKKRPLKPFPFKLSFIICFVSYTLSYLYGRTFGHYNALISPLVYFLLVYLLWCYWPLRTSENIRFFFVNLFVYLFILSLYGIYNAYTGRNEFVHYLYTLGMLDLDVGEGVRYGFYRAQSLTLWFETFAAVCGLSIGFLLMCIKQKVINSVVWVFCMIILLLFSVLITGSRSMMIMTAIISSVSLISLSANHSKVFSIIVTILVMLTYYNEELLNVIYDSIVNQDNFSGSSTEMRTGQFLATLSYWRQSPIIGLGPGQLAELTHINGELFGGESIVFSTLVNYGLVGVFALFFLYWQIINYLIKIRMGELCIFPIGFLVGKILTMLPGMGEAYIMVYLIPLIFWGKRKIVKRIR